MEEGSREFDQFQDHLWQEHTLALLHNHGIGQGLHDLSQIKKIWRKHKLQWMQRRPMEIPEVILDLQREENREYALRCLSSFLILRREDDPENYQRAGFFLFNSCATMTILLQELVSAYWKMVDGSLTVRETRRLGNVLTLFQSMAANNETRLKFVQAFIPNFLVPLILFESTEEAYENIRGMSLSVIGIICQEREPDIIKWAVDNNIVEICRRGIQIGGELSKVIAMHIIEAILQDKSGISYICKPEADHLLKNLLETWEHMVMVLSVNKDHSPRLLFHIIRCYVLLCTDTRGFNMLIDYLPEPITNNSFQQITEEFPVIRRMLEQLLMNTGKVVEVPFSRRSKSKYPDPIEDKLPSQYADSCTSLVVANEMMPLNSIDPNTESCSLGNSKRDSSLQKAASKGKENWSDLWAGLHDFVLQEKNDK
ncbi:hypothetical protein AMTRI_Chr01g108990 [Amborella trichopoda]